MEIYFEFVQYGALLYLFSYPTWWIHMLRAVIHNARWEHSITDWLVGACIALLIVRGLP